MTVQLSVAVRNARLDAIETIIAASAVLKLRTGAPPANCAAADSGSAVSVISLPADWMSAAAAGAKAKLGTWSEAAADASGVAGHFRLYASDGVTCHGQGTITATAGGGDMTLDNISITLGQPVVINAFTLTDGNA